MYLIQLGAMPRFTLVLNIAELYLSFVTAFKIIPSHTKFRFHHSDL